MSTDRIKGKIVFICDECEDALETETGDFAEANQVRQDAGWLAFQSGGWVHRCPSCKA